MRQIETEMFVFCESTKLPNSKARERCCTNVTTIHITLSQALSRFGPHLSSNFFTHTPLSVLSAVILWYALKCLAMYWLFLLPL